jgi:hypothetical protein
MNSRIILSFFVLVFLSLTISFVFAQEMVEPSGIEPIVGSGEEEYTYEGPNTNTRTLMAVFIYGSFFVSLVIGIFLMVFFIRKPSRKLHLIIHGLTFFGSLIVISYIVFDMILQLARYGEYITSGWSTETGWPFLFLLILSGYIFFNLRKEGFATRKKVTIGLSSGMIIISVLSITFLLLWNPVFDLDGLVFGILTFFMILLGTVGSFILGMVGFLIDKLRSAA